MSSWLQVYRGIQRQHAGQSTGGNIVRVLRRIQVMAFDTLFFAAPMFEVHVWWLWWCKVFQRTWAQIWVQNLILWIQSGQVVSLNMQYLHVPTVPFNVHQWSSLYVNVLPWRPLLLLCFINSCTLCSNNTDFLGASESCIGYSTWRFMPGYGHHRLGNHDVDAAKPFWHSATSKKCPHNDSFLDEVVDWVEDRGRSSLLRVSALHVWSIAGNALWHAKVISTKLYLFGAALRSYLRAEEQFQQGINPTLEKHFLNSAYLQTSIETLGWFPARNLPRWSQWQQTFDGPPYFWHPEASLVTAWHSWHATPRTPSHFCCAKNGSCNDL